MLKFLKKTLKCKLNSEFVVDSPLIELLVHQFSTVLCFLPLPMPLKVCCLELHHLLEEHEPLIPCNEFRQAWIFRFQIKVRHQQ